MKKALVAALLIVVAIPLLAAVAQLPPHGSRTSPAYTHVSAYYLEHGAEEAGAENIVTDVILNYRGFDTNGEVTVIFTSLAAVLAVLLLGHTDTPERRDTVPVPVSMVVLFVTRLMAPFIAMFAIYVILNGHISPGGGFQGGTILGALFIAISIVMGRDQARSLLPAGPKPWLQAAAPLTFMAIGLVGAVLTGAYLGFPTGHELRMVTTVGLVIIEIGIGVGGAAIVATLFDTMGAE